jgi:hypothetical protein
VASKVKKMNVSEDSLGFCNSFSLIKVFLELFFYRPELDIERMHSVALQKQIQIMK